VTYEPPVLDPARLAKDQRLALLEAKVAFLLDEVSGLRSLVRHLGADKLADLPTMQQTRDSFDYQWRSLPEGLPRRIEQIRSVTDLPIAVGFGVSDRSAAADMICPDWQ